MNDEKHEPPGAHLRTQHGQRVVDTLHDMLDFADMAANLTAMGRDSYNDDINLQLAGEAICHRMGEAAARLLHREHEQFIAAHPDIDWLAIRGLRNVVAHQYEMVDHRLIWNALAVEFPADAAIIRVLLAE